MSIANLLELAIEVLISENDHNYQRFSAFLEEPLQLFVKKLDVVLSVELDPVRFTNSHVELG